MYIVIVNNTEKLLSITLEPLREVQEKVLKARGNQIDMICYPSKYQTIEEVWESIKYSALSFYTYTDQFPL